MIFSFDLQKARKGDCFLLHWGEGEAGELGLFVVDGGPASVYRPYLRPRLQQVRQVRALSVNEPLRIDALMVSHIDDDHIHGILDLTKELLEARNDNRPPFVKVAGLWHNSFDDIVGNTPEESRGALTAGLTTAAAEGADFVMNGRRVEAQAALVLASVGQGHRLRSDAGGLDWRLNPDPDDSDADGELVIAKPGADPIQFDSHLSLTIVGPMKPELDALRMEFEKFLAKSRIKRNTPEAALAAFSDESIANLSSIVVLAEAGGKRMLLTGDARGDKILEGLELVGLLKPGGTIHVDLLKVPHHGSDRNMEPIFFEHVTADHYVFSGDGEHGNPERETLEMLFQARGGQPFTMHFTYPIAEIDAEREKDWIKELEKRRKSRPWSVEKDSLGAFFAGRDLAAAGQKIAVVRGEAPHVIDLLDPLGF